MSHNIISDVHEWINEIPTVPIYYLVRFARFGLSKVMYANVANGNDVGNLLWPHFTLPVKCLVKIVD